MSTSMIYHLLYTIVTTLLVTVFGQDLCSVSSIDSIDYIADTRVYFITSGANFWVVKEVDMMPRAGKRLKTFSKVDAAVYIDWWRCPNSTSLLSYREKHVILVSKSGSGNMYLIYDMRSNDFYALSAPVASYSLISQIHINWGETVDAMFTFPPQEVYAVQGNRYAGSNWTNTCGSLTNYPKPYTQTYDAKIDFETNRKIDAMMYKANEGLYVFTGDSYYILLINDQTSGPKGNGKMDRISKGTSKPLKHFFKCDGGGDGGVVNPPPGPEPTDGGGGGPPPGSENPEEKTDAAPAEGNNEEKKGKGSMLWIIIGVILLIIVIAIIAILVFLAMRRKKEQSVKSSKSATTATSRKSKSASKKTSPSQFDKLAVKSTASSKQSRRSKWNE